MLCCGGTGRGVVTVQERAYSVSFCFSMLKRTTKALVGKIELSGVAAALTPTPAQPTNLPRQPVGEAAGAPDFEPKARENERLRRPTT